MCVCVCMGGDVNSVRTADGQPEFAVQNFILIPVCVNRVKGNLLLCICFRVQKSEGTLLMSDTELLLIQAVFGDKKNCMKKLAESIDTVIEV